MEISAIIPHVEALIFVSEKPVPTLELVELVNNALGFMEERATLDQVESAMDAIREKYASEFYPFELRESGGGWQFLTKAAYHKTVALLNGDKFLKRLSTAALETLAIIAYKQPITKGEIENIRGVNCDYAVQKLLEKELVIITGRKEDAPGHPLVYATSKTFMDYFGINSPDELPKLSDILPQDIVSPTAVGTSHMVDADMQEEEPAENEEGNTLVVDENGNIAEMSVSLESSGDEAAENDEAPAETDGLMQQEEDALELQNADEPEEEEAPGEEEDASDNDESAEKEN